MKSFMAIVSGTVVMIALLATTVFPMTSKAEGQSVRVLYYIIGGDLEAKGGAASRDLREIMRAEVAEDVQVYILTGGAGRWEMFPEQGEGTRLYTLRNHQIERLDFPENTDMADPETLRALLDVYAPTEETWHLIFWGHGNGCPPSVGGDENGGGSLALSEIRDILLALSNPPGVIGLDACRMATMDTCLLLSDCGQYLIADTEEETKDGWSQQILLSGISGEVDRDVAVIVKAVSLRDIRNGDDSSAICLALEHLQEKLVEPLLELILTHGAPEKPMMLFELLEEATDEELSKQIHEALDGQDILLPGRENWQKDADLLPEIGPYLITRP